MIFGVTAKFDWWFRRKSLKKSLRFYGVRHSPRLNVSATAVDRLQILLKRKRVTAHITPRIHFAVVRDSVDDKSLDAAVAAKAEYLVTNNKDLLSLHEFRGVRIINVHDFLETVNQ